MSNKMSRCFVFQPSEIIHRFDTKIRVKWVMLVLISFYYIRLFYTQQQQQPPSHLSWMLKWGSRRRRNKKKKKNGFSASYKPAIAVRFGDLWQWANLYIVACYPYIRSTCTRSSKKASHSMRARWMDVGWLVGTYEEKGVKNHTSEKSRFPNVKEGEELSERIYVDVLLMRRMRRSTLLLLFHLPSWYGANNRSSGDFVRGNASKRPIAVRFGNVPNVQLGQVRINGVLVVLLGDDLRPPKPRVHADQVPDEVRHETSNDSRSAEESLGVGGSQLERSIHNFSREKKRNKKKNYFVDSRPMWVCALKNNIRFRSIICFHINYKRPHSTYIRLSIAAQLKG